LGILWISWFCFIKTAPLLSKGGAEILPCWVKLRGGLVNLLPHLCPSPERMGGSGATTFCLCTNSVVD